MNHITLWECMHSINHVVNGRIQVIDADAMLALDHWCDVGSVIISVCDSV